MTAATAEEGDAPTTDSTRTTLTKLAAVWFRIDGHLDRFLAALKHLASLVRQMAALITRMENRTHGPPPDYPSNQAPWGVYYGDREPTPREPSWQNKVLSIVGSLLVAGILAIFAVLWAMNENIRDLRGDSRLGAQRMDAMDKHLEATDKDVAEIKREIWPHKH